MNLKITDCTIRDGGFLNNWQFNDDCVKSSYFAALRSGVDYFEIGYKASKKITGRGQYGSCHEDYISNLLQYSDQCKLLYMVDANKFDDSVETPECNKNKTPFSGVRIATYPNDVKQAIYFTEQFYHKGYEVFLNLMTFSEWRQEQFDILKNWNNKEYLQAVYFVDSFGSFIPRDISLSISKLKNIGFKDIGFHGHNSLQMAFANTIKAIEDGACFVDGTIYGMGRGAGNLPIEILIGYLHEIDNNKYNPVPYLDAIDRFYLNLSKDYQWGYTLKSLLGGIKNIHPYYTDSLLKSKNYTIEEIWNVLNHIKTKCPVSYSEEKLKASMTERFYIPTIESVNDIITEIENQIKIFPSVDAFSLNETKIINKHMGRNFLIVANGPSIVKYEQTIKEFITKHKPITIGCNYLKRIYEPTYHIFISRKRFLKYASSISKNSTLIVPTFFGVKLVTDNYNGNKEYIEIKQSDYDSQPVDDVTQQIVNLNVAISAIITAYQMGAKEIMVVGMDGYENENNEEMVYFYDEDDVVDDRITASFRYEKLMEEMKRVDIFLQSKGIPLSIITPTSHKTYYRKIF